GRAHAEVDVPPALLGLGGRIADPDELVLLVERDLARDVDGVAAADDVRERVGRGPELLRLDVLPRCGHALPPVRRMASPSSARPAWLQLSTRTGPARSWPRTSCAGEAGSDAATRQGAAAPGPNSTFLPRTTPSAL